MHSQKNKVLKLLSLAHIHLLVSIYFSELSFSVREVGAAPKSGTKSLHSLDKNSFIISPQP
jgi:hypothetical protein